MLLSSTGGEGEDLLSINIIGKRTPCFFFPPKTGAYGKRSNAFLKTMVFISLSLALLADIALSKQSYRVSNFIQIPKNCSQEIDAQKQGSKIYMSLLF
jgi:hypothetical protein